ncbi:YceI family protein [Formosa algae]|uniref:Lipid/polyisoprenoid-binding YceI-like domain-containing protein n=1 Tax=Formosa algae TaxID=225843 RepID=A0A9X1C8T8_9FLAO|nr:YceI family protein [Formosa algae]MBP1839836.1 hypothetical protein [Formosa algae]MDQ0335435.1 hypothetical protein [Formosa algae]OEI79012.1 hypothetical protein AST99_16545 [Formosa algae]
MMLKKITLFLIVIINLSFIGIYTKKTADISIKPSSTLTIYGETNITDFSCVFNSVALNEKTPITYITKEHSIIFKEAKLVLENKEFDCGKRMINKDFRSLLKTEIHPEIAILLKEVQYNNEASNNATALVDFVIAGVTKHYKIPISVTQDQNLTVNGNISLDIRDFNLENPKKALGLIKIDDEVTVHFKLDLEIS